jgi:hypothetical protein
MTLEEAAGAIGKSVVYRPFKDCKEEDLEYGIITTVSNKYVFVRYDRDLDSKATSPSDLKFV